MTGLDLRYAVMLKRAHSARPSKLTTHLKTSNNLGKKIHDKGKKWRGKARIRF
jgi:hypothetical protein